VYQRLAHQMQQTLQVPSIQFTEVFSTQNGAVYQSDSEGCWYIDFASKLARFDYRNLLKLKKAVYQIDIEERLLNSNKSADLEIIFICACDHCYVLSLLQIIKLKEILQGTFTMLELNHILFDRLHRIIN
jgi:ABC-type protease/lipase transport system fused ATPase/permease subunit